MRIYLEVCLWLVFAAIWQPVFGATVMPVIVVAMMTVGMFTHTQYRLFMGIGLLNLVNVALFSPASDMNIGHSNVSYFFFAFCATVSVMAVSTIRQIAFEEPNAPMEIK